MADTFEQLVDWAHHLPDWPDEYVNGREDVAAFGESYHDAVNLLAQVIAAAAHKAQRFRVRTDSALELAALLYDANDEIDAAVARGEPLQVVSRIWRTRKAQLAEVALQAIGGF